MCFFAFQSCVPVLQDIALDNKLAINIQLDYSLIPNGNNLINKLKDGDVFRSFGGRCGPSGRPIFHRSMSTSQFKQRVITNMHQFVLQDPVDRAIITGDIDALEKLILQGAVAEPDLADMVEHCDADEYC
jgi:hypothetical protein